MSFRSSGCAIAEGAAPSSVSGARPNMLSLAGLAKRMRPSAPWRVMRSIELSARKRYMAAPSAAARSALRWRSCVAMATRADCITAARTEAA
jgi:hypothetical protein